MRSRRSSRPSWSSSALTLEAAPSVRSTDFWASVVVSVVSKDTVSPLTRVAFGGTNVRPPSGLPPWYDRVLAPGVPAAVSAASPAPLAGDAGGELGEVLGRAGHRGGDRSGLVGDRVR